MNIEERNVKREIGHSLKSLTGGLLMSTFFVALWGFTE